MVYVRVFLDGPGYTAVLSLKDPGSGEGEEEEGARQVDMYLHRKFQNVTEMLMVFCSPSHTLEKWHCPLNVN